jgi:hypothetical protein
MRMRATVICTVAVAVLSATLVFVAPVTAAAKSKHRVDGTALGATIRMSQDFPNVGSTVDNVQLNEQRVDGGKATRGVAESSVTVRSGDLATGLEASGPIHSYSPQGSMQGTTTTKVALQPDGSVGLTGEIKVTGGTGTFKGATGTLSFTASVPNLTAPVAAIPYSGTLSY